jgi:hypothetical protein
MTTGTPPAPPSQNCTDIAFFSNLLATAGGATLVPVSGLDKQYVAQANWWHVFNQQPVTVNGLSFTVGNPGSAITIDNNPTGSAPPQLRWAL